MYEQAVKGGGPPQRDQETAPTVWDGLNPIYNARTPEPSNRQCPADQG